MSSRSLAKKHEALNREIGYESRDADLVCGKLTTLAGTDALIPSPTVYCD